MKQIQIIAVCCGIILLSACDKKKSDDFDRTALLTNLYSNVIVPNYITFQTSADALKVSADTFLANPNTATLNALKTAYTQTYIHFQSVEFLSFTQVSDLRNDLNSFPPDTAQINNNIATGTYNLSSVNNIRAKGFPAIDYLLFSQDAASSVSSFSNASRKTYLNDIVTEIHDKAKAANDEWNSIQNTFVSASGTDAGSSVGMLVNDLSFAVERNRRERTGNALGYVGVIQGGVLKPEAVEAYYSGQSKALLIENLQQLKTVFEGGSGIGFDDYLNNLGADYNGTPLATEISVQFDKTIAAAEAIPVKLSEAVSSNNAAVEALFLEQKKLVVLIKVDMSSNLGVIINYSDNDGD